MISVLSPLISRAPSPLSMDTILLVILSIDLLGVAAVLAILAGGMSKWTCPHVWEKRILYEDRGLYTGNYMEWHCDKCDKRTYKDPFK